MTLGEFKAWLEGFSEGFSDCAPTPEQWAKVQEKLEAVTVFVPPAGLDQWQTYAQGHVCIPSVFDLSYNTCGST